MKTVNGDNYENYEDNYENGHSTSSNPNGPINQDTQNLKSEGGIVRRRVEVGPGQGVNSRLANSTVSYMIL